MRNLSCRITSLLLAFTLLCAASAFGQSVVATANTCPLHAGQALSATPSSGALEIVAVPVGVNVPLFTGATSTGTASSPKIVICSVSFLINQAGTAANFGLVYGTGTNCGTGKTNLTPQWIGTASIKEARDNAYGGSAPLVAPMGKAVCLSLSQTPTNAQVFVTYAIVSGP